VADTLGIAPRPTYLIASVQWQTEPPVQVGDEITYIGRQEVAETINSGAVYTPPDDVLNYIAHEKKVTVRRDGTQFKVQVTPEQRARGQLGIEPTAVAGIHQETFLGSLRPAVEQTLSIGTFAFVVIWKLITGDVSLSDLMGPVGIVQQTYLSVERGYSHLFWLIHLITVNIGVFNLIPIPPLDGGRIAMLVYEKLRGRQPSRRFQEAIMLAGLALVLLIFVVATFNDVRRLIFS
jgi:regulator of sigma E protease